MKYWIIIDSWNLMETFTTESLSPHSFYLNRSFGSDLTRYISKDGELFNNLVLYRQEPLSDYAIEIDSKVLDESLIKNVNTANVFLYPRTIYYKNPYVRFRFKNEDSIKAFIAESKIIFEVKTIDKYLPYFICGTENAIAIGKTNKTDSFSFDLENYIYTDNLFNSIKGGIVSYVCGEMTTTSLENQSLFLALTSLKNIIAGLNTTVMMGEEKITDYSPYKIALAKTRNEFSKSNFKTSINLFEVLKHLLDEIISLSSQRLEVVEHQKSPNYASEVAALERKKDEYKALLYHLEDSNIRDYKEELSKIREEEVKNGEREGKKRKYFPKDSIEFIRKNELKALIKRYKKDNSEYRNAYREYKALESSLANSVPGVTQYDSAISALFVRFSDNINDILRLTRESLREENANVIVLPQIDIQHNKYKVTIASATKEEEMIYNILINYIISHPNGKQSTVSDSQIIDIVEETGRLFKKHDESSTPDGEIIMETLRDFWLYKNQKTDIFNIPDNLPIMQAIISFLIKPRGFDQIERFMLNRGYQMKKYAFFLWGCLVGYASMPKTLTSILNKNPQEEVLDDYLAKIYGLISKMTYDCE